MKLLFVIPPYFDAADYLNKDKAAIQPAFTIPYGILSMQAYIGEHGKSAHDIRIIDLNINFKQLLTDGLVDDFISVFCAEIKTIMNEFRPNMVGISALFNSSSRYIEKLAFAIKEVDRNVMTLAGGGLPSAAYSILLNNCPDLDAVCKGEGEIPLCDLMDSDDPWSLLRTHPSWICRDGIAIGKQPQHTFIHDLDDIPPFDYRSIDLQFYNQRSIGKKNADEPKREMSIHTSRGCPFLCVFCSNPSLHGRDVRMMSVKRVVADVKRMRDEFGMTVLMIEDDHFFHDRVRAKAILRELATLGIRVEFPNGVAVYAIDEEVAELFSNAGVSAVALAVESGSDYVLNKIIKKPLKKKLIKPAVDALRKFDVRSHVFIVIGLPGELDSHREETLQMLLDNGFDWVHVFIAMPIYGSRLYDICVENGYIIKDATSDDFVIHKSVIRAPGVDPDLLEKYAYEMQLRVNFVDNYNIKVGRYDVPADYLKNVVTKYPDHAFGHHFLSLCYSALGLDELADKHRVMSMDIFEKNVFWRSLAEKFNIPWLHI